MLGAIIGDIVGSRFEFENHRSKEFALFTGDCQVTDDSVMTLAIAQAIMETAKQQRTTDTDRYSVLEGMTIKYMQQMGRDYPRAGYGGMFLKWIFSDDPQAYNSFGNGAAMRISPVAYVASTEEEVCRLSAVVTGVTHNHIEGLKGAEAIAMAIYSARQGAGKNEIRDKISSKYYQLNFTLDEIRHSYQFNPVCQYTVPPAIKAFLESTSFEDALRNAVSIGGDSDTLACITGSIAEAYYGIPAVLQQQALAYLDDKQLSLFNDWLGFVQSLT